MYVFGIENLDKYLGAVLKPNSTIVIAGHPGAGKTTLASTICYSNALRGSKCLYISFQEDKEKLFGNMKNLGMDFYSLEAQGYVKYVQLPLYSAINELINELNNIVAGSDYKIIVVDSINAVLETVARSYEKRAWLQNYFYSLSKAVNGLCILVAELPFGMERLKLGSIEFVADAILILKHSVVNSILVRKLEIRKARFAAINVAEIPFTIRKNKGIEVYIPPLLEEIGSESQELDIMCKPLKEIVHSIRRGMIIYVSYPPDARPIIYVPIFLGLIVFNKLKALVISYHYPPEVVREIVIKSLEFTETNYKIIEKTIDKYIEIVSLNPYAYSIEDIAMKELSIIREEHNAVIFHGIELITLAAPREIYVQTLYNQLNYLKHRNKLVVRIGSIIDENVYKFNSALADMVIRLDPITRENKIIYNLYIWRRGLLPSILEYEKLLECCRELANRFKHIEINT